MEVIGDANLAALERAPDAATLTFTDTIGSDRILSAGLVVGADGARSWVRHAAGLATEPQPYGQTAVVANFACERAHHGVARQWFRTDGSVLAWLPLPGRRMSIVWSAPDAQAAELRALDASALAANVANAGEHALGALVPITAAATFPLAFLKLPATIAHRLALVGDAAHGVHPLAGQGVNLGFGDDEALAAVLAVARAGNRSGRPGAAGALSPDAVPDRCWPCKRSPTDWSACSGRLTPRSRHCAMPA